MTEGTLQTEFDFTLPQGYVDKDGSLHREGTMRLANAADEIEPLRDPKVEKNSSYLTIILLARVIEELGTLETVNRRIVENMYVKDLEYLQNLYARINHQGSNTVHTACPDCGHDFDVDAGTGAPLAPEPAEEEAEEPTEVSAKPGAGGDQPE